jgi:hypothetical protein
MQALLGLFGAGSAAAPAAAATATTTAAAAPAFSVSQLLGGTATLLSAVSSIAAGNQQADALKAQAIDTQSQKSLELIQGLDRKNQAKKATAQAVSDINTAYAASGADLTFGTPAVARASAFQEGDFTENSNTWTTGSTIDRLEEKRQELLRQAGYARMAGLFEGFTTAASGISKLTA